MLYIVSTSIGNLEDITFRAIRILREVDAIVCEDTRVTRTLLDHYEIKKPLYILHERSTEKDLQKIVAKLDEGKTLAYVTDAGTPGVADPGGKLVSRVTSHESRDIQVVPIPGPSSLTAAISVCGLNMQEFSFFGFLPHKKGRQTKVKEIIASEVPVVLFESKYRIVKLLEELIVISSEVEKSQQDSSRTHDEIPRDALGMTKREGFRNRQIVVCNDLTKKFERVYRGTVGEILLEVKKEEPKGEFVVIINHVTRNM